MRTLYALDDAGRTSRLPVVYCKNEDVELQRLLAENLWLLPGDQIDPDAPRNWLLIGREIAVPSPTTGTNRWSIDLVLGDQDAVPTLVECKRFKDTRHYRETVGQMFDYAANGQGYWSSEDLHRCALASCGTDEAILATSIDSIGSGFRTADEYFEAMEQNLRDGRVRLVFFMDEARPELKSIVEFLNRQMEQADVLIVEALQFQCEDTRLVVPTVFGYSEEARRAKRRGDEARGDRKRRLWDEASFFEAVRESGDREVEVGMRVLYDRALDAGVSIKWGTGSKVGSFGLLIPDLSPRSILTINSTGVVWLNAHWLDPRTDARMARLLKALHDELGEAGQSPPTGATSYEPARWLPRTAAIVAAFRRAAEANRSSLR